MVEQIPESLEPTVPRLILVVDDERRMIRFIRMNLELEGYQVIEASNGLEALEQTRQHVPDLIIMDVMMPELDGFETLRLRRETLHQFYVPGFDIESLGKLDRILERGVDKYHYIVVDEAHRFRNELTSGYEALHKICRNKKVILVSATPLNNKLEDIKTQIKLFQPAKNSTIPGVQNLDNFFKVQQKELDQ